MKKEKKVTILDKLLSECIFKDKKEALSWIMMRKVYVNGELVLTGGQKVYRNDSIKIKGYNQKYVNKGGLKLEGALKDFSIDVSNKVAIDIGASTGGFTDCLIQFGARKVYAVDVGFGQLSGKLLQNPNVVNMEKTNISDARLLELSEKPEIATLDLSYLSLRKAIPICADIMNKKGIIIGLVKPIYEVESSEIRRNGEINDKQVFYDILTKLVDYINLTLGYNVFGITYSPVRGNKGTIEFFIGVSLDDSRPRKTTEEIKSEITYSIDKGWMLDEFDKSFGNYEVTSI
jgi:23S rRNA (cytidine1920-2'-O)/16S rRNA (cytidine1409-2'-O)-methyltransferase